MQLMHWVATRFFPAAVFILFCGRPAFACSCVGGQPFCNALPTTTDDQTAIFVGVVRSVYPTGSVEDYVRALYPNPQTSGSLTPSIDDLRNGLLRWWHGVLTAEEEQRLKDAKTESELQTPLKGLFWTMPRRVQLEVLERFTGPAADRLELFTGIGGGDCGVDFKSGESFLVVAKHDPTTDRWSSTICSRTRPARYAGSDLAALRAWKKGETPEPTAYGTVEDWTNRGDGFGVGSRPLANLRLRLRSGEEEKKAITDADGHFDFAGLAHKVYLFDADLPGWRFQSTSEGRRNIDLTKAGCSELFLSMEELQGEVHGRLEPYAGKPKDVLWVEAIPAYKNGLKSRTGWSKPDGSFAIDAIEPGDYVIALDVEHPPTTENGRNSTYERITPYPPMYFPGTAERARAEVFHLERGQILTLSPWKLPEPAKERTITGVVLWPNRKPASTAKVVLTVESTGIDAMHVEEIGNDGKFTVFGLENLPYRVRAAAYDPTQEVYYKGSAEVPSGAAAVVVVLELDGLKPSDKSFFPEQERAGCALRPGSSRGTGEF
jgi:hypothetical protein